MAKTLAQRIAQLEKIVTDYFSGGEKKTAKRARKSPSRRKAKKTRKVAKRSTTRKAARA